MKTILDTSRLVLSLSVVAAVCLHHTSDTATAQQRRSRATAQRHDRKVRPTRHNAPQDPHNLAEVTFESDNAHIWQGRAGSGLAPKMRQASSRLARRSSRIYNGNVGAPPVSDYVVEQGGPYEGDVVYDEGAVPHGGCADCGDASCDVCDSCGSCDRCAIDCPSCCRVSHCGTQCDECIPLCLPRLRHMEAFVGVHGFKGPRDLGTASNFGFQQGFNIAGRAPLIGRNGVAYQFGYQAVQSQLSGDFVSNDIRTQHFITGGLFRRTGVGIQGGVVFDYLRDDYDVDRDFKQVRAEVSLLGPRCGEFGFWTAIHVGDREQVRPNVFAATKDQYAFFYRRHFEHCGEGRIWGGFTDERDGLVGGDFLVPVGRSAALSAAFNYVVPRNDDAPVGVQEEAWNLGINLVWYPRGDARCSHSSPYRPLFNVADNGTMVLQEF